MIRLHFVEFEALILADPAALIAEFMEHQRAIDNLVAIAAGFESPELINDGENTAPSKRIDAEIRGYAARKVSAGPRIAARIGLPTLRSRCPHFDYWIGMLESLSDPRP